MEVNYSIRYEDTVFKDILKLDGFYKARIQTAIFQKLLMDPLKYGKPLQFSPMGLRSLRVGKYRVLFYLETTTIAIYKIGHRGKVYRNIFNQ